MVKVANPQYYYHNEAKTLADANRCVDYFESKTKELDARKAELERQMAATGRYSENMSEYEQVKADVDAAYEGYWDAQAHRNQLKQWTAEEIPESFWGDTVPTNPTKAKTSQEAEQKAKDARTAYAEANAADYDTPEARARAMNDAAAQVSQADKSVNYYAALNSQTSSIPALSAIKVQDLDEARTVTATKATSVATSATATPLQKAMAIDDVFKAEEDFQIATIERIEAADNQMFTLQEGEELRGPPQVAFDTIPDESTAEDTPIGTEVPEDAVVVVASEIPPEPDFRVRIRAKNHARENIYGTNSPENLMYPLWEMNGVVFPFTPTIAYSHSVNYSALTPTHANTDYHVYTNTAALQMQITAQFSAQNDQEARYMLACSHFFRSITKMRFGESDPLAGLPPPVVLLSGYGEYMFNDLPVIINTFTMDLPSNVDYVQVEHDGATTWLPSLTTFNLTVTVQTTPEKQRTFDWNKFASGALMRDKGWL